MRNTIESSKQLNIESTPEQAQLVPITFPKVGKRYIWRMVMVEKRNKSQIEAPVFENNKSIIYQQYL
jgi:hypothetical protein